MSSKDEVSFALKLLILSLVDGGHASMEGEVEYQGKSYTISIKEVKDGEV